MNKTRIVFRTFTSGVQKGKVIALLIDESHDFANDAIMSYMHIGQHSPAHYKWILSISRLSTPEERESLLQELQRIGYTNIEIMYRKQSKK